MQNSDHKIMHASFSSAPPPNIFSPEGEAQTTILINNIVDPLKVRMFSHGGEEVIAGKPKSIGVPEGKMPPLPIPLAAHLTYNEAGIVNTVE